MLHLHQHLPPLYLWKTITRQLLDLLPGCVVLHQDSYYRKEDEPGHVHHPSTNYIDWEVLQAFHMDRMVSDARAALASHQRIKTDLKPAGGGATFPASPSPAANSVASLPPNLLSDLARVSHLPLLLIEGICVLNEPRLVDLCHLKFFLEIDEATCRARREQRGEWDEGDDCWSETPEYFRQVAWPGYVLNREGLRNVPGVIYLDSKTNTVDEQLIQILNRVLSHLQDQL